MILLRTWTGIADHFPVRWSEWVMAVPALGMAAALSAQPDMFTLSPSFDALAAWGDESTWAAAVLICGLARLVALAVNGTFHHFRYSPHLRMAASLVGGFFWSQFCLGIMAAALAGAGAASDLTVTAQGDGYYLVTVKARASSAGTGGAINFHCRLRDGVSGVLIRNFALRRA